MPIILKTIRGLFTSRLILHTMVLCVVYCLPAIGAAQSTPVLGQPSVVPSTLHWNEDYSLSVTAISRSQPTQATTLTLYIEVGGVSKRIDETPYGLADEFLPLQKEILIPGIGAMTSREVRVQGQAGTGLIGTTTLRYCDDEQTVCTPTFEIDYRGDPPSRSINGNYQLSISTSTVVSGLCAAVRERTQRIEMTQTDNTASYHFTDDFGQRVMLSAAISANTYVYTAQYSTAPAFPGTSTLIVRADFSDDDNGNGLAHWSYESEDGENCKGDYRIRYSRAIEPLQPEGIQVHLRVFLEGLLIDDSYIVSSVTISDRVQDTVLSRSGMFYTLEEDHTLWTITPSGVRQQLISAAGRGDQVDIHDLVFVEHSLNGDTLYIVDAFLRAVIAVDLSDGSRTVVSGCDVINRCPSGHYQVGSGVPLTQPTDAVLDEANNRLIITDAYSAALIAVDLTSGERSVVSGCTIPDLCPTDEQNVGDGITLLHPQALDKNSSATRLVVVDDTLDALIVIDAVTGDRAVLSGCRVREVCVIEERGFGPSFDRPIAVVFDEDADLAYVADNGLRAIIEVDLAEGNRSEVLSPVTVRAPYHLSLDPVGNRVLVYDEAGGTLTAIAQSTRTPTRLTTYTKESASLPPPPQDLTADVRNDAIALSWRPVARATSYKIYWNTFANLNAGHADQVISDIYDSGYVHSGLARGQLYYYAVSAVNDEGESDLSEAVSVMLPVLTGNDEIPPIPPRIISIHASSNTAIALDWMASTDDRSAAEQIVYEVHVAESTATIVSDATKRVMVQGIYSAGVGRLETSHTYYVSVAALDEAGNRSLSESIAVRTMSRPPMISTQNKVMLVEINAPPDADGVIVIDRRDDLRVGHIIIATSDEGIYLRKITRIEFFGNQMRLYTEAASLQDAFANLDLNMSVNLEDVDDEAAIAAAKSAAVQASRRSETVPQQDTPLRRFLPTLDPHAPPPAVWPYQPTYDGEQQIREMHWPDSGFKLRQTDFISQADDTDSDSATDGVGLRSEQQTPKIHIPGTYNKQNAGGIHLFYPSYEVIEADEVGSFDIYVERRDKQCTIDSVNIESITKRGINISQSGATIQAKRTDTSAQVTEYRLTWQTYESLRDRNPYKMHLSVVSSCATQTFAIEIYIPHDLGDLSYRQRLALISLDHIQLIPEMDFDFVPQIDIRATHGVLGLKSLEAIVSGEIDMDVLLKLITKLKASVNKEIPVFKKKFYKIIPVGYVPVLVSGELSLNVGSAVEVSSKMDITQRFQSNYKMKAGFRYANNRFRPIRGIDSNGEYNITVKNPANGMMIEFSLFPQFELQLYESAFTNIDLKPHVYGEASIKGISTDNYRYTKLDTGVGISAGVSARTGGFVRYIRDLSYTNELFNKRRKVTSLPTIDITRAADNSYTASMEPGKWFFSNNEIQESHWSVIPSAGAPKLITMDRDSVRVDQTRPIEGGKYKLRYTGYSRYGKAIRQYHEEWIAALVPDMVIVPAGSFIMGSPADEPNRYSNEGPQHRVTISQPFAVGKYEVTRGQFKAFVDATGYDAGSGRYSWQSPGFAQTDTHPVVYVSWNDAEAYVNWLSARTGQQYRLLTEAEWEYVARAGTTTAYHFGDMISSSQANYNEDNNGTVAVGSYPANAFGLHDVHGNVWEWVEDCWHNNYTGAPTDGSAWVDDCDGTTSRVLRGGSWIDYPRLLRSAYRVRSGAGSRRSYSGFRIARTL